MSLILDSSEESCFMRTEVVRSQFPHIDGELGSSTGNTEV